MKAIILYIVLMITTILNLTVLGNTISIQEPEVVVKEASK